MEFEEKVTIRRPLAEVFAYMSDAENDAKWRTNVISIERVGGGDHSEVGTVYKQVVKGPMGRKLQADFQYTVYEPNKRLAFDTIEGSVRPSAVIDFTPVSDDTTEVRFHMTWVPEGGMKASAPIVGKMLKKSIHESYQNLVHHIESLPTG